MARKGRIWAVLGQAKLALRFRIPLQASLRRILKTHRPHTPRVALLGGGAAGGRGLVD